MQETLLQYALLQLQLGGVVDGAGGAGGGLPYGSGKDAGAAGRAGGSGGGGGSAGGTAGAGGSGVAALAELYDMAVRDASNEAVRW